MTDWEAMQAGALDVRQLYDELNLHRLGRTWDLTDFVLGFVGDVGDLAKLIMARQGRRADVRIDPELVAHELSDCLFSLIVIAHEAGVPLGDRFTADMAALAARVRHMDQASPDERAPQSLDALPAVVHVPPLGDLAERNVLVEPP